MLQNNIVNIDEIIKLTNAGLKIATFTQIRAALIDRYKSIYGSDIDLSTGSADGIFVNDLALIINNIFDLLWSCGIQTVLFIAGLQAIPRSLYESSKVEGATKWEEFWFITFPMLGSVTLLVSVFTMVELFTSENNTLVERAYAMMDNGVFDESSTMLWIYFVAIGAVMGIILFCYNRFLMKRWQ